MEQRKKTCNLIMMHYKMYPELKIVDMFKYLYQSAFGCEHMITSFEMVKEKIFEEFELNQNIAKNVIEPLAGKYSRVYLGYLNQGLSVDTFSKLFYLSAKRETDAVYKLEEKLAIAKELVEDGLLPFSKDEFEEAVKEWKSKGYPAVRHSSEFRDTYHPAYRVIANEYVKFLPLFAEIDKRLSKGAVKLAIEGGSASGKTTLGDILKKVYDCTVLHMDDFFLRPEQRTLDRYSEAGGNIDRERFLEEVLIPLDKGEQINYRRFDCSEFKILPAVIVKPKKLTVIEGTYSMHPEFQKYYDISVYLDISPDLQEKRILKRNSPQMANRFFDEWIPLEKVYFSEFDTKNKCTFSISIE